MFWKIPNFDPRIHENRALQLFVNSYETPLFKEFIKGFEN